MKRHNKVLTLIKEIRNSHPSMEEIYSNGSCYNLYCILKVCFPQAEAYYDGDHVITEIEGCFYDINGEVVPSLNHTLLEDRYSLTTLMKIKHQLYHKNDAVDIVDISILPKDISLAKWHKLLKKGYFVYDSSHINTYTQKIKIHDKVSLIHIDVNDDYGYLLFKELMDDIDMC
jgi:hypothetical protein